MREKDLRSREVFFSWEILILREKGREARAEEKKTGRIVKKSVDNISFS